MLPPKIAFLRCSDIYGMSVVSYIHGITLPPIFMCTAAQKPTIARRQDTLLSFLITVFVSCLKRFLLNQGEYTSMLLGYHAIECWAILAAYICFHM
jgi:hypothetical protein